MIYVIAYFVTGAVLGAADIRYVQTPWLPADTWLDRLKILAGWVPLWPLIMLCRTFG